MKFQSQKLLKAAETGYLAGIKWRLNLFADIECRNSDGYTPLMLAVKNNHFECVRYLIKCGADINALLPNDSQCWHGNVLHLAAYHGFAACLKELIDHGCNVNKVDDNDNTPLHAAIINGNDDCAKILIRSGADYLNRLAIIVNNMPVGIEAIRKAIMRGRKDLVMFMVEHMTKSTIDYEYLNKTVEFARFTKKDDIADDMERLMSKIENNRLSNLIQADEADCQLAF